MFDTIINDRLVEMVFEPAAETARWLQTIGVPVEQQADGVFAFGNAGVRTAIYDGLDPVSKAVTLGFGLGGQLWPYAFPGLLKAVNQEWQQRNRQARQAKATAKHQPGDFGALARKEAGP